MTYKDAVAHCLSIGPEFHLPAVDSVKSNYRIALSASAKLKDVLPGNVRHWLGYNRNNIYGGCLIPRSSARAKNILLFFTGQGGTLMRRVDNVGCSDQSLEHFTVSNDEECIQHCKNNPKCNDVNIGYGVNCYLKAKCTTYNWGANVNSYLNSTGWFSFFLLSTIMENLSLSMLPWMP